MGPRPNNHMLIGSPTLCWHVAPDPKYTCVMKGHILCRRKNPPLINNSASSKNANHGASPLTKLVESLTQMSARAQSSKSALPTWHLSSGHRDLNHGEHQPGFGPSKMATGAQQ